MRKLLILFLWLLTLLSFAQKTETLDGATYTIPQGWKKLGGTTGVSAFTVTNNQNGAYCQIAIYKPTPTKGNVDLDFKSDWEDLIVKPYKPTEDPTLVPPEAENGWLAKSGTAPFEFSGSQAAAMLITISGHGKCVSIVIVTNTADYQSAIEHFLESVDLTELETAAAPSPPDTQIVQHSETSGSGYQFSTSNFDDGWTSTVREDWVEVIKGDMKVLIHYPNKMADEYNTVLLDKLHNSWNILVAPRYSSARNLEFKPISDWQSIEFAEGDLVERATGRNVYVVLFRFNYSGGNGTYMEFIARDKQTLEQEFGPYHPETSGWEKMERMAGYNKFAIAGSDLNGT
jgi:hypothetical protein